MNKLLNTLVELGKWFAETAVNDQELLKASEAHNGWFTKDSVISSFKSLSAMLEEDALKAWLANIFLSAKNNILGSLLPSLCLFHLAWNNFQAIWKAITVLPVPVAKVNSILCCLSAIASNALLIAISW